LLFPASAPLGSIGFERGPGPIARRLTIRQPIAAFESLAQRLEAMAEARRPWWRRLVG
jgi:hypothetical protein